MENLWSWGSLEQSDYFGMFEENKIVWLLRIVLSWFLATIERESCWLQLIFIKKNFSFMYLWLETDLWYVIVPLLSPKGPNTFKLDWKYAELGVHVVVLVLLHDIFDGVKADPLAIYCCED